MKYLYKKFNSIYIHIPFCKQACHYCNFHFSVNFKLKDKFVKALLNEISLQKNYFKDIFASNNSPKISSIYFGGGTPSILDIEDLESILSSIFLYFNVEQSAEITLEMNPHDLSLSKLQILKQLGFNRLSIGIQSFDDKVLKYINRAHDKKKAIQTFLLARKAGFDNISIDLIYGIPKSNIKIWENDLKTAINIDPEHISSYCLTIEKNTYFGKLFQRGKYKKISDYTEIELYNNLVRYLSKAGYDNYEISNFCKPNKYSLHNINYWKRGYYLGLGPSAHSYDGEFRIWNVSNNKIYIDKLKKNIFPNEKEKLDKKNHINEYIMTSLRTKWGCDAFYLKKEYNYDILSKNESILKKLKLLNHIKIINNTIFLKETGKLLSDQITLDLILN